MTAAYRSSTSANTASTPANSLAINVPSGVQPGDNLFACISVAGGTGATTTPPLGWTLLGTTNNQGTNLQQVVYWRLATGTETSSYTWTFDTTRQASGAMTAYSGGNQFIPTSINQNNSGTSNTTCTPPSAAIVNPGLNIGFFSTENTTGQSTLTAANTGRVDTTTTASQYIETEVQDQTISGLPLGGTSTTASTASQSVVKAITTVVLESNHFFLNQTIHTPLVIDSYTQVGTVSSSAATMTVGEITSHFNNELIMLQITIHKDVQTVSSISGGGLTWSLAARRNTANGSAEIWYALAPTPVTDLIATVTFSANVVSAHGCGCTIIGVDASASNGSNAIGATAGATSSSAAPTVSITTTRAGSWVFGCENDPTAANACTAGSGLTLLRSFTDATNSCGGGNIEHTSPTANSGTSVTVNFATPTTDSCNIVAVEILPSRTTNVVPMLV